MFKVGDKIIVLPGRSTNSLGVNNILEGQVYEITGLIGNPPAGVYFLNKGTTGYGFYRFELFKKREKFHK